MFSKASTLKELSARHGDTRVKFIGRQTPLSNLVRLSLVFLLKRFRVIKVAVVQNQNGHDRRQVPNDNRGIHQEPASPHRANDIECSSIRVERQGSQGIDNNEDAIQVLDVSLLFL